MSKTGSSKNGVVGVREAAGVLDLSLAVFDRAQFRPTGCVVKLPLRRDHDGHLPSFAAATAGKTSNLAVARGPRAAAQVRFRVAAHQTSCTPNSSSALSFPRIGTLSSTL